MLVVEAVDSMYQTQVQPELVELAGVEMAAREPLVLMVLPTRAVAVAALEEHQE
jgi:hypothetical protein